MKIWDFFVIYATDMANPHFFTHKKLLSFEREVTLTSI